MHWYLVKFDFDSKLWRGGADARPHYQKLCARANPIWISRKGQLSNSVQMCKPHLEPTALMIAVQKPAPGKYEL